MKMQADKAGVDLIKGFEGLRLHAYQDVAGVWTIGYGCTYYVGGKPVKKGDVISEVAADVMLSHVLEPYEGAVNSLVKVPLTQNKYNAILSFTYNEGIGALKKSTLLKKLNASDYQGAADQFGAWNKVKDTKGELVINDTQTARRRQERELFLTQ